ncbi:MAG: TraR/DksA family transcriptional regulator [Elusimicrobia bacterium]|nr:TraR/DksA family transcriptional regulator [Elusimicrobiota bacterium]
MAKKKTGAPNPPAKKRVQKQPGTQAYEKRLLQMREDIIHLVRENQDNETENEVGDEADAATKSAERELLFELSDNERQSLDAVEAALRKINTGAYGLCESCRTKIAVPRLKAIPHARYCIHCQSRFDSPRS